MPPEASIAVLALNALLLVLQHALPKDLLRRRALRDESTPVPHYAAETEHELRLRLARERAELESMVATYLRSEAGRTFLDNQIQHRIRSMLTGVLLSCGSIRIDDPQLSGLRHQVIEHVRDALRP